MSEEPKVVNEHYKEKPVFQLTPEELANPKFRKGYPGRKYRVYPKSWNPDAVVPHANYREDLSSFYKAGKFLGIRSELMSALNATLPPPKPIKREENENNTLRID
jgi:hypothetical protein